MFRTSYKDSSSPKPLPSTSLLTVWYPRERLLGSDRLRFKLHLMTMILDDALFFRPPWLSHLYLRHVNTLPTSPPAPYFLGGWDLFLPPHSHRIPEITPTLSSRALPLPCCHWIPCLVWTRTGTIFPCSEPFLDWWFLVPVSYNLRLSFSQRGPSWFLPRLRKSRLYILT